MIVKFFKVGTGAGYGPVQYCTAEKDFEGKERTPTPEVVRGDPEQTRCLIDSLDFEYKYTSGVLASAPGEVITPEMEERMIDAFESTAFAGLDSSRYDVLWIRHTHAGKHELHFVIPRVELETGKSLNVRPPGKQTEKLFDAYRNVINTEFGLVDPDDPSRAKGLSLPDKIAKQKGASQSTAEWNASVRETITDYVRSAVDRGDVQNRDDVVQVLKDSGLEIPREGKNYVTVQDPESGSKFRMKGPLFDRDKFDMAVSPALPAQRDSLEVLESKLAQLASKRAAYHLERYGEVSESFERDPIHELQTPEQITEAFNEAVAEEFADTINQTREEEESNERTDVTRERVIEDTRNIASGIRAALGRVSQATEGLRSALQRLGQSSRELGRGFAEKVAFVRRKSFMDFARKWGISTSSPSPPDKDRGMDMG